MRISDWSSDVCSSDLLNRAADEVVVVDLSEALGYGSSFLDEAFGGLVRDRGYRREDMRGRLRIQDADAIIAEEDRKSVGEGKRVSRRVDLGGRRITQKKK